MWDLSARRALSEKDAAASTGAQRMTVPVRFSEDPRSAIATIIEKFLMNGSLVPPDWWITLTFRNPTTRTTIAVDALRSWLSQWRSTVKFGSAQRPGCSPLSRLVWCAETQLRGTAHIHAIGVSGAQIVGPHCPRCWKRMGWKPDSPTYRILKESWFTHHGIARFLPYREDLAGGCAGYVAKYMFKGDSEWGLWESGKEY